MSDEEETDLDTRVYNLEGAVAKLIKEGIQKQVVVHKYEIGTELSWVLLIFALAIMLFGYLIAGVIAGG
jgi:hypothetical protein